MAKYKKQVKNILTNFITARYTENSQSNTNGGRFPFRSENSANNRIALNTSGNIALFKVLDGGRSPISRGMGALAVCNVTIPATFFSSQKRGEINKRRLAMGSTQYLSILRNLLTLFTQTISNYFNSIFKSIEVLS